MASKSSGKRGRSAITGRFVKQGTVKNLTWVTRA